MDDFDALQRAIRNSTEDRLVYQRQCETFLNALYHAMRGIHGRGQPLANVSLELVTDPGNRVKPIPVGGVYAAWLRVGLFDVYIRLRHDGLSYVGEYAQAGRFTLTSPTPEALLALARQIVRDGAQVYAKADVVGGGLN